MINDYEATEPITSDANAATGSSTANTGGDVVSTLNELIEICRDGQEGFKTAAEGVERSELKTMFYEYSQQRAQFVGELQDLVRQQGGDPENTGHVAATLHRAWIDIKSVVTGKDEGAILNECERGEDYAKDAYKRALEANLPGGVSEVIQRQSAAVMEAHDKVKAMRNTESGRSAGSNA
jgi:uncharacterized protein (TIGR02284 family)